MRVWPKAGVLTVLLLAAVPLVSAAALRQDDALAALRPDTIRLPGAAADLAAAVGLPADTPRARLLVDVIRLVHGLPPGVQRETDVARTALLAWLAAREEAPAIADERAAAFVPSPLTDAEWASLCRTLGVPGPAAAGGILRERRLALAYVALLDAPPATRAWLRARPDVLAGIVRQSPGAAAAFLRSVTVVADGVAIPGGDAWRETWTLLAGDDPRSPERFVPKLLDRQGGRLAWLLDVLVRLPASARWWSLGAPGTDVARQHVKALARVFAEQDPSWRVEERPFSRPAIDGALVLDSLRFGADGQWQGPVSRRFWRDLFQGRRPGRDASGWSADVADAEPVSAAWLLEQVLVPDASIARQRVAAVRAVQRLFPRPRAEALVSILDAGRAMIDAPALVLILERLGVREPVTFAAAAAQAQRLSTIAREAGTPVALAQFQASLALLDRAVRTHVVTRDGGLRAVDRLLSVEPGRHGYGDALRRWFREHLASFPVDDLTPLEGSGTDGHETIEWEGLRWDLDFARFARRRLGLGLRTQRAPSLAAAWAFVEAGQAWLGDRPPESAPAARRTLLDAAERVGVVTTGLFTASPRPARLGDLAARLIGPERASPGGVALPAGIGRDLEKLINEVIAEALLTLVYAPHLGDPEGPVALVPDVARRHAFSADDRGDPLADAWRLPVERHAGAGGWRVGGSLLVLEHALAGLALKDVETGEMPEPSRLSEAGQQLVAFGVALMEPARFVDDGVDRLLARAEAGRAQLAQACADGNRSEAGGRAGWRHATADWACIHDPGSLSRLWTTTDGLRAFEAETDQAFAPWAPPSLPGEGPLVPEWPLTFAIDDLEGRPATGLVVTRFMDLSLRVARLARSRGLPAALVPALLERAAFDVLHGAPLVQPDDWFRLAQGADALDETRFEDFMAALTADGPLMPPRTGDPR